MYTQAADAGGPEVPQLASMLEGLPDPAWIIDPSGVLVDFNTAFASFLRGSARHEAAVGAVFHDLIAGSEHEVLLRDLAGRVHAGRSVAADVNFNGAGIERAYTIHGTPARASAFFIAREVTVHHTLRDDSHELALMHLFGTEESLERALTSAIAFLCTSDGWDAGVVWLIENDHLVPGAIWLHESLLHPAAFEAKLKTLRCTLGHGLPGRAWASGDVIWVPDLFEESTLTRGAAAALSGIHTMVAVPMIESERTIGVLEVAQRAVRPLSPIRRQSLLRSAAALARLLERRRAEDERRRLIELVERKGNEWAMTFDAIRQPTFLTTPEGSIVRLNRAARELAGAANYSDILGRRIGSLAECEPWLTLRDLVAAVADSGQPCTAHVEVNATIFDVEAAMDAEAQRIIVALRDTTEIVQLQESVRRGEQLAALGELVAGVAHQVKNPLFGIGMTVDLLQERIVRDAETDELIGALRKWLHRLDRLMESLLAYGKTWTIDLHPHGIREVVEQAVDVCRPTASANGIQIEFHASGDAILLMDPQRLVHAFENLITNAAQHSPRSWPVVVTLTTLKQAIELTVSDRGPGFQERDLARIFEPFFTRRRGGTGLGLSIVQRVVDEHGGTVTAENSPEGGAVVRVRIPRYDERTERAE